MAKRPDNIYSWSLARLYHHNKRFAKAKQVEMNNVMKIIDRAKDWVVQAHVTEIREKQVISPQAYCLFYRKKQNIPNYSKIISI